MAVRLGVAATAILLATPVAARDSLGMFDNWGAFRDPAVPRCYAIARAERGWHHGPYQAYADIANWPRQGLRGQVHFRMSHAVASGMRITLAIGGQHIALIGGGADAWVADPRMNPAIIAAMRFVPSMSIYAHDNTYRRFVDSWQLTGAASAIDSATIGCAELH